jgi:hypothetical protein
MAAGGVFILIAGDGPSERSEREKERREKEIREIRVNLSNRKRKFVHDIYYTQNKKTSTPQRHSKRKKDIYIVKYKQY